MLVVEACIMTYGKEKKNLPSKSGNISAGY